MYKTAAAALHLFATSASDSSVTHNYVNVTLTNSTGTLLAAVANNSIILAFNVRVAHCQALFGASCHRLALHFLAAVHQQFK